LLLRFSNKIIGHLMVDVLSRPAIRQFRLVGTTGTAEWDQGTQTVRDYRAETGAWNVVRLDTALTEPGYLHSDIPYVREMADFIAAVRGERAWPYPYVQDQRTLDLLARAEASDEGQRHC
jgi:predicted dehydrogenase